MRPFFAEPAARKDTAMKLSPDAKLCLEELYLLHAVATDQLKRASGVLNRIVSTFNGLCDTSFEADTLLRYMINRRKNKDWPCLGERARRFEPAVHLLTASQLKTLEAIYVELDITSDEYLFGQAFAKDLVKEFGKRTGSIMPAATLVAVIFGKRKRGEWVCIREEIAKENKSAAGAFSDIEEADRIFKQKRKNA